jgi:hypothetical protein
MQQDHAEPEEATTLARFLGYDTCPLTSMAYAWGPIAVAFGLPISAMQHAAGDSKAFRKLIS